MSGPRGPIPRDLARARSGPHDLIVIGGGIQGACVALEAARRGLRPLLLERADFGGGTSWSSLRIVHGGLRYLQRADWPRFRESIRERRWFLENFPDIVKPLSCVMPLHGRGLRRRWLFALALPVNDLLSRDRNRGLDAGQEIPPARLLMPEEVRRLVPGLVDRPLEGGAFWTDAVMTSSERLLLEILHWACRCGALALNYVEAEELLVRSGRVAGVRARDLETGSPLELEAGVVVSCAGPAVRALARRFDRDVPALFAPALAFNLLLDVPPPAREAAVAVTPDAPGAPSYFVLPWKGRTLAGTVHLPLPEDAETARQAPRVPAREVDAFLTRLRGCLPGWAPDPGRVLRVYAGFLPARRPGDPEPAHRPVIHDHGGGGGPRGFYSVSGVKYTTARDVAERALGRIFGDRALRLRAGAERPAPKPDLGTADETLTDVGRLLARRESGLEPLLEELAREESVLHLDDLVLRRMDGAHDPASWDRLASAAARALGWGEERAGRERARLEPAGGRGA